MKETRTQAMQTAESDDFLLPLRHMNLIDDFLFDVATVDLEVCKILIELSLGIQIREIRWKEGQKVIHNLPGRRGIRMDFYVEDDEGRIFDVEMQKRKEGHVPKRTRFYQALNDAPLLKSGEKSFDSLKPTYIVIICGFDLYGFGKYRYTFENSCNEVPGLKMGDACTKVILNTKGKNDSEVERSLVDFLHYVAESEASNVQEDCDERLKRLHKKVNGIKSNRQMGVTYMKMEERDRLIKESGKAEGEAKKLIQQICKKMQKGKTPEQIADILEEELGTILPLYEAAEKCAPEYDLDEIYDLVRPKDED
ncbi:MAG: Rpn family recombination-promoting nuclease/putative transposase [Eubacteriales bacterium]|nr:Rpn family recombination-promoting nuclease/putative transposase [Eubacteriales bacterium]